jgi:hypothetical protein
MAARVSSLLNSAVSQAQRFAPVRLYCQQPPNSPLYPFSLPATPLQHNHILARLPRHLPGSLTGARLWPYHHQHNHAATPEAAGSPSPQPADPTHLGKGGAARLAQRLLLLMRRLPGLVGSRRAGLALAGVPPQDPAGLAHLGHGLSPGPVYSQSSGWLASTAKTDPPLACRRRKAELLAAAAAAAALCCSPPPSGMNS